MKIYYLLILFISFTLGCRRENGYDVFYSFPKQTWHRFNVLSYEIPVEDENIRIDIEAYAQFTSGFPYNDLEFNAVITTPSGEERMREIRLKIQNESGKFTGIQEGETYTSMIVIQKGLLISKRGVLKVELENLIPKVETPGLIGLGIRIVKR